MKQYLVIHKDYPRRVVRWFDTRSEANYYITDCYGPEYADYKIIEIYLDKPDDTYYT